MSKALDMRLGSTPPRTETVLRFPRPLAIRRKKVAVGTISAATTASRRFDYSHNSMPRDRTHATVVSLGSSFQPLESCDAEIHKRLDEIDQCLEAVLYSHGLRIEDQQGRVEELNAELLLARREIKRLIRKEVLLYSPFH